MRLTEEERAMDAGEQGLVCQWAIRHQIAVGEFFDAGDFVAVSLAHVMADTESLGRSASPGSKAWRRHPNRTGACASRR